MAYGFSYVCPLFLSRVQLIEVANRLAHFNVPGPLQTYTEKPWQ